MQEQILCTVGILNILGDGSPLKATEKILATILPFNRDMPETLYGLRRRELLTFRQMDQSFRLWEGGSIDLEALLQKTRTQLRCEGAAFLELIREYVSMRPMVARKHCLQSGAYRFFDMEYAASAADLTPRKKERASCEAGRVLVLLPMNDHAQLEEDARKATLEDSSLIIAIPQQLDMLRQPAIELACLRWVEKQTPALRGDRRALREYSLLLSDCERRVRQNAKLLLDPRPAPRGNACRWFWNGKAHKVARPADVTRLLSDVCDTLYPCAPRIRNELVARPFLSSAGTAARNILLKRMLSSAASETLGIEGLGDIDLPWGRSGKKGFGLAHIIERRNEQGEDGKMFARRLPKILGDGRLERREDFADRAYIIAKEDDAEAVIRLNWDSKKKVWLATVYLYRNKNSSETSAGPQTFSRTRGGEQRIPSPRSEGVKEKWSCLAERRQAQ